MRLDSVYPLFSLFCSAIQLLLTWIPPCPFFVLAFFDLPSPGEKEKKISSFVATEKKKRKFFLFLFLFRRVLRLIEPLLFPSPSLFFSTPLNSPYTMAYHGSGAHSPTNYEEEAGHRLQDVPSSNVSSFPDGMCLLY